MSGYLEFNGKTLDEAIDEACSFYAVPREKLEIEIMNDAKSGIFGLVGAKKANIRARKVKLGDMNFKVDRDLVSTAKANGGQTRKDDQAEHEWKNDAASGEARGGTSGAGSALPPGIEVKALASDALAESSKSAAPSEKSASRAVRRGRFTRRSEVAANERDTEIAAEAAAGAEHHRRHPKNENRERNEDAGRRKSSGRDKNGSEPAEKNSERARHGHEKNNPPHEETQTSAELKIESAFEEHLPEIPLESMDQDRLHSVVLEALDKLTMPIVGETEKLIEISEERVRAQINSAENSGLLIGRDGQTLSALQYLVSCIASRRLNASIRVQIDAGDYRERQEEKLRELALNLAEKVKSGLRPQSTRPLSAYHRRIIHVTLRDDPDVQTHSKGEGGLKRVIIVPKRKMPQGAGPNR